MEKVSCGTIWGRGGGEWCDGGVVVGVSGDA